MSDVQPSVDALPLLADPYAQEILIATYSEPMTASTLANRLDAAPSTVYDRIDDLGDAGFLSETTRTDDRGNHYAEYRARLDGLHVRLSEDGLELTASYRDRDATAERLHALWSDLR